MDDEPWHGLGWQKAADSKIYSSFVLSENPEMLQPQQQEESTNLLQERQPLSI